MFRGNKRPKSPKNAGKSVINKVRPVDGTKGVVEAPQHGSHRSHHLAFVFPAFERKFKRVIVKIENIIIEFPLEFEAMRNIISEIQQYCFEMDMEIE